MTTISSGLRMEIDENVKAGAVNRCSEPDLDFIEIREFYKQPLILCKNCSSLLAYKSNLKDDHPKAVILSDLHNYRVSKINHPHLEEVQLETDMIHCPGCLHTLGIKTVSSDIFG